MEKPKEECGVFGIVAKDPSVDVAQIIFRGLMALQHRGQEAAGISVVDSSKRIHTFRDHGLVFQALKPEILQKMWGHVGIGHVRYGTAGSEDIRNAQPFHYETTQSPPFSLVYNGNITNYQILKEELKKKGKIFLTNGDTEVIANIIASNSLVVKDWIENIEFTAKILDGAFSIVILTNEGDLYAYRSGNKPLCYGTVNLLNTELYIITSETSAITSLGGTIIRDTGDDDGRWEVLHISQRGYVWKKKE